jgi:hypothetical protein
MKMGTEMATKMITTGAVEFNGATIELGKSVLVNGRKGTPFLAWIRDGVSPDGFQSRPSTDVRFKWEGTYMPSDFSTLDRKAARIEELGA